MCQDVQFLRRVFILHYDANACKCSLIGFNTEENKALILYLRTVGNFILHVSKIKPERRPWFAWSHSWQDIQNFNPAVSIFKIPDFSNGIPDSFFFPLKIKNSSAFSKSYMMMFLLSLSNKCSKSRDKTFLCNLKKWERRLFFSINEKHVPFSLFHIVLFPVIAPAILCWNDLEVDGNHVFYKPENIYLDL